MAPPAPGLLCKLDHAITPTLRLVLMSVISGYCLWCLVVLEKRNRAVEGGVLQQFYGEYAEGGSMKWRFGRNPDSDPRKPTYQFIKTFGLSVFPVAIIGAVVSGLSIRRRQSRAFAFPTLAVCSIVLLRFLALGVLPAAFG